MFEGCIEQVFGICYHCRINPRFVYPSRFVATEFLDRAAEAGRLCRCVSLRFCGRPPKTENSWDHNTKGVTVWRVNWNNISFHDNSLHWVSVLVSFWPEWQGSSERQQIVNTRKEKLLIQAVAESDFSFLGKTSWGHLWTVWDNTPMQCLNSVITDNANFLFSVSVRRNCSHPSAIPVFHVATPFRNSNETLFNVQNLISVKLPQVYKILRAKSAEGISILSVTLEMVAIISSLAYGFANKYPFRYHFRPRGWKQSGLVESYPSSRSVVMKDPPVPTRQEQWISELANSAARLFMLSRCTCLVETPYKKMFFFLFSAGRKLTSDFNHFPPVSLHHLV